MVLETRVAEPIVVDTIEAVASGLSSRMQQSFTDASSYAYSIQ